MRTVKIKIDGQEYEMPRAFRAVRILAAAALDGTYRIFQDRDGLLSSQLHPDEWVIPSDDDKFVCVNRAIGPGGGDGRRVQMINAAMATEDGDEEAWTRFEEWERSDD